MSDTVIKIENISKLYNLGNVGTGSFSDDVRRWWANARGKEDPFAKLAETNDRSTAGSSKYVWALKDINFDVKRGDVIGIIGKNGAGKSTLLKILSRTTTPSTGCLKIKGRIASLLEVGTGFHPDLSGRENVFLNGAILGMTRSEIKSKFDEIIDFSGVERYIDTPVKRYSSGMYVRLAFAVAAHLDPEILIVDEVLAVGDMEFQKRCIGKMKDVSTQGRTILFVSHNMAAVRNLCTSGILLKNGSVQSTGTVDHVMADYLKDSSNNRTTFEQENNFSKKVNLRKISILNNNGIPSITHNFENDIVVEIEYDINKEIDGLNIWIALRTLDDQIVFASTDNDTDPAKLETRKKGKYSAKIIIPKKLVNSGSYRLVVGLNQISGEMENFDRYDEITFSIEDLSIYHSKEISERPGIIKPFLNWTTKKID